MSFLSRPFKCSSTQNLKLILKIYKEVIYKRRKQDDKIMKEDTLEINKYLIGDRIREAREGKHLSQLKLAELANLSLVTVSNMESGKFSPNLKNLIKVSKVLGVTIDFLVSGSDVEGNEIYIQEINTKLNKMDEQGLKHINRYIDLYNETIKER